MRHLLNERENSSFSFLSACSINQREQASLCFWFVFPLSVLIFTRFRGGAQSHDGLP